MKGRRIIPGMILIILLLVASLAPISGPAAAEEQEGVQINVYMDRNNFKLEMSKKGYNESLENVYLDSYLKATENSITGYLKAWGLAENATEISAYNKGYLKAEVTNTTAYFDLGTESGVSLTVNSTLIDPGSPPEMLPTTIIVLFGLSSLVELDTNESTMAMEFKLKIDISDGLPYVINGTGIPVPMITPGDFALWLNLSVDTYTNVAENRTKGVILVYIDFETGNPLVDAQLTSMLKKFLPLYLSEQMIESLLEGIVVNPTVTVDQGTQPGDSSIYYIKISYQGQIPPAAGTGIADQLPVSTVNVTSIAVTPTFTPVDVDMNLALEWGLEVESVQVEENQYNISVDAYIDGSYTGPKTTISQGELEAWAKIEEGYYECYLRAESGYENPVTGLMLVKQLSDILYALLPEDTLVTINFITGGGVKVVDTSKTPPVEVSTVSFRAGEIEGMFPLDSLGVIYDNVIIDTGGGILTIVSSQVVRLDYEAATLVDYIEAQAPGVEIVLGAPSVTMQTFTVELDPNSDMDPEALVEVKTGSTVGDTFLVQVIDRDQASQLIDTGRYTVAGVPLKGKGLLSGEAVIELKVDRGATGIKVLKITEDGQVEVVGNVEHIGDKVRFTASSFSTYIPVVEKSAPQETTTTEQTTETTTTQETTTTTTQEATETTTTTTQTTTTTEAEETTTTTTETEVEETTTTTQTTETTTGKTTTETTTETGETTTTTQQQTTTRTLTRPTGTTQTGQTTQTQEEKTQEAPAQETQSSQETQTATTQQEREERGLNPAMIGVAALIIIIIAAIVLLRR